MRIVFFDTETTGGAPKDRLIQLGVKERGVAEPVVNALYTPPVPISIESMVVHHITPKMVEGKPAFKDAPEYGAIKELFENSETYAVAHNAVFDREMLRREGVGVANMICTFKLARAMDERGAIGTYSLQYLRYALELDVDAVAHDAWGDVLVLEALFERLFAKMVEQEGSEEAALAAMLRISNEPTLILSFTFGKHKGKLVADVAKEAPDYLEWLLAEKRKVPLGEEDWIFTLEKHLGAS
jgi:DNA polymerase III epsilon subunit-like protein